MGTHRPEQRQYSEMSVRRKLRFRSFALRRGGTDREAIPILPTVATRPNFQADRVRALVFVMFEWPRLTVIPND